MLRDGVSPTAIQQQIEINRGSAILQRRCLLLTRVGLPGSYRSAENHLTAALQDHICNLIVAPKDALRVKRSGGEPSPAGVLNANDCTAAGTAIATAQHCEQVNKVPLP